jgi:hypothetical protein
MRILSFLSVLLLSLSLYAQTPRTYPVVVELYTSEGCSSCPPADRLLAELERQSTPAAEIIPLALHVDYWDQIGWKDRFSSAAFTHRQEVYVQGFKDVSPYTPEMIVDGREFFVGSDASTAQNVIRHASLRPKPATVNLHLAPDGALAIEIDNSEPHPSDEVWLAITESNLTTSVAAGENHGHTLHHTAVVRQLKSVGHSNSKLFSVTVPLTLAKDWKPADLRAVVFLQRSDSHHIIGVASIPLN